MRSSGPYEASVPPFIAERTVTMRPEVLALADDASRELTRFDSEVGTIAAPFASILLRSESASSSEVEQLSASAKQVALAEVGASRAVNAKLIVANVQAMRAAIELAEDISMAAIIEMQRVLLEESAPHLVGEFRHEQVWVGGTSISPHGAQYVAPHDSRVEPLMRDLIGFTRRLDIPVLIHTAIAHAHFETIHPFADGNGRTGRALIQAMLRHGGLTKNVAVPVSAGLLKDTGRYFDALTSYREGDIHPIIEVLAEASFAAVHNGRQLVQDLERTRDAWLSALTARKGSAASRVRELLLTQPVVSANIVAEELSVSTVAAQQGIDRLVEAGILVQTNNWKRNRIWHAPEVLDALDQFAARARRKRQ